MPSNPPRLIICDISEAPRHRSVPQTISALHPGRPVPPAAEIHPSVMFPAPKRGPYPSISIYKRNTWSPPRAAARAVTYDFGLWRRDGMERQPCRTRESKLCVAGRRCHPSTAFPFHFSPHRSVSLQPFFVRLALRIHAGESRRC
jgi:hypothetical protein